MKSKLTIAIACLLLTANIQAQCWQQVTTGRAFTAAIKNDGTLWAWGQNNYGQLGDGTDMFKTTPLQIGSAADWKQVAGGEGHTAAIKNDGTLWAWGANDSGQLGDGTNINKNIPVQIGSATDWKLVTTGWNHTLAIKNDGTLWAWGANNFGQLGDGTITNRIAPVQIGTATNWQQISAGFFHTTAIRSNGALWAWGNSEMTPVQIGTATDWQQISAGASHTAALKTNGALWTWGQNTWGQLGNGTTTDSNTPVQIGASASWQQVAAGGVFTLAIKSDGTLWGWGQNMWGQLGNGTNTVNEKTPVQIGTATDWKKISAGDAHSAGIKNDQDLWIWGRNNFGQLGNGTFSDTNSPAELSCTVTSAGNIRLSAGNLQIFPNPAQNYVIVHTEDINTSGLTFEVSNMLGEVLITRQQLTHQQRVDVNFLAPGFYILTARNREGQISEPFVKI